MSSPAVAAPPTEAAWLDELARQDAYVEVVDGRFVVKRDGGNQHHRVTRLLANAFEEQWPGVVASAPGNWVGDHRPSRHHRARPHARRPCRRRRAVARQHLVRRGSGGCGGLVALTESGDVHLEWHVNSGTRWELVAAAVGETPLQVSVPRPFIVVPNALLR